MTHATSRNAQATGEAPSPRCSAVGVGPDSVGNRPSSVGAAVSSVFRWWQAYRRKGTRGLDARPTPGRPPRLSNAEKRQLVKLLTRGALRAAYRTDLWTLPRVTELIHQQFGVRYHPAHVWKVRPSPCQWNPGRSARAPRPTHRCDTPPTSVAGSPLVLHLCVGPTVDALKSFPITWLTIC